MIVDMNEAIAREAKDKFAFESYSSHECGHGGNVLSDAGFCRCYSGRRRYKIPDVYESDLNMGNCNAPVFPGCVCMETAGGMGSCSCPVRSAV